MAGMSDELKNFLSNLFAAQEVTRKQEHKEFKEDIQEMIKDGIKSEVEAATKPLKDSQDKIVKDQADLVKTVKDLTKKVEELERGTDFPVLRQSQVPKQHNGQSNDRNESVSMRKDDEVVRKLFKKSNLTLGISPISQEFLEAEVQKRVDETGKDREDIKKNAMKDAVKEFLTMEMKVKEEHFEKLDIVRIFAPQKTNWNTVYLELETEEQVDWIMSHTRWIPAGEKGQVQTKVTKYIPRQLYSRWNALQGRAFSIRKESNWTVQTKIGHGKDDFYLQTRVKGEREWGDKQELPADLPKVELEFMSREERSPTSAPGRERYKTTKRPGKRKERPSSGSSSSSGSPPPKQGSIQNNMRSDSDPGLLARPNISKIVESMHPPGSPGHGITNPNMFTHLSSDFVSCRKK